MSEDVICQPHWERRRVRIIAERIIDGTPMCARCFHGDSTSPRARRGPKLRVGDADVVRIEELIAAGIPMTEIAKAFKVSARTIYSIKYRRRRLCQMAQT